MNLLSKRLWRALLFLFFMVSTVSYANEKSQSISGTPELKYIRIVATDYERFVPIGGHSRRSFVLENIRNVSSKFSGSSLVSESSGLVYGSDSISTIGVLVPSRDVDRFKMAIETVFRTRTSDSLSLDVKTFDRVVIRLAHRNKQLNKTWRKSERSLRIEIPIESYRNAQNDRELLFTVIKQAKKIGERDSSSEDIDDINRLLEHSKSKVRLPDLLDDKFTQTWKKSIELKWRGFFRKRPKFQKIGVIETRGQSPISGSKRGRGLRRK